jgi:hypothetical protein
MKGRLRQYASLMPTDVGMNVAIRISLQRKKIFDTNPRMKIELMLSVKLYLSF